MYEHHICMKMKIYALSFTEFLSLSKILATGFYMFTTAK